MKEYVPGTWKPSNDGPEQLRLWTEEEHEKLRDSFTSPTLNTEASLSFEARRARKAPRQDAEKQHVARSEHAVQRRLPGL